MADKNSLQIQIDEAVLERISQKVAKDTVDRMREFHKDDLRVFKESIEIRLGTFEASVNERFDRVDERFDRLEDRVGRLEDDMQQVKSALQTLLEESKQYRQQVTALEKEVAELRSRVQVLEQKLAAT